MKDDEAKTLPPGVDDPKRSPEVGDFGARLSFIFEPLSHKGLRGDLLFSEPPAGMITLSKTRSMRTHFRGKW